jgi:50S ribosomal subunit-associated GTPase HflX
LNRSGPAPKSTGVENKADQVTFQPGKSGNPGGRPKADREVVELARAAGPDAIRKLIGMMDNADPKIAMSASVHVLERAYGKPAQPIVGDDELPPVQVEDLGAIPADKRKAVRAAIEGALRG